MGGNVTDKNGAARRQQHKNASQDLGMVVGAIIEKTPVGQASCLLFLNDRQDAHQ